MTAKGFLDAWSLLTATFGDPGRSPDESDARGRAYRIALHDCDDDALKTAALRCCRECPRFPVPRDLLERLPGALSIQSAAAAAWSRVHHSATQGPTSYNPSTGTNPTGTDLDEDCLGAIGGRTGLANLAAAQDDPQQVGFIRRDFIASYEARRQCEAAGLLPDGSQPAMLPGAREEFRRLSDGLASEMRAPPSFGQQGFEERRRQVIAETVQAMREGRP